MEIQEYMGRSIHAPTLRSLWKRILKDADLGGKVILHPNFFHEYFQSPS